MINLVNDAFMQVKELVMTALGELVAEGTFPEEPIPAFISEIPADPKNGDVSTNAAMVCARPFRNNPRAIAQSIVEKIRLEGSCFERCEVAGPGFINFFYSPLWYAQVLKAVLEEKEGYGKTDMGRGKRVLVEFVSANPTGPMHIGNARGGAIGDCLAAVLEKAGYEVEREFYVNDAGNQIEKFGKSLSLRYMQILSDAGQSVAAKGLSVEDFCKDKKRIAVLMDVVNPVNVGAIFRSAAALGMDGVLLTHPSVDPLTRRTARVSMGTVFQIPWAQASSDDPEGTGLIRLLNSFGYKTVAMALTSDSTSVDNDEIRANDRLAVILGTEGTGLPKDVIAASDYRVMIPMYHGVDSLNVAAASAISFWELMKQ